MKKILLFVGVGLAVGGALAVAAVLGVLPVPFGPLAEARAAAERAKPPVTVMYPTKERVVNLMDKQTSHYLKVQLTLEFIDTKVKEPPKGDAVKAQQDEFAKDMQGYSAVIEDALTTTLSSKTSSGLLCASESSTRSGFARRPRAALESVRVAVRGRRISPDQAVPSADMVRAR